MANVYQGTLGLIGNTPLVEVTNVEKALGLKAKLLVKLEYFNPAGSVKDRIAKAMRVPLLLSRLPVIQELALQQLQLLRVIVSF